MNPNRFQSATPQAGQEKLNIAVIGSGISGIASAWLLSQKHHVTLFEKNNYLGGHTHTVTVQDPQGVNHAVDTGFIVYNEPNYPLLTQLFKHLNIPTQNTEMSFSVSINDGEIEYSGNNLNTLFAQRKNLFSFTHWQMITDIIRFNRIAKQSLQSPAIEGMNLADFLAQHQFSDSLKQHYLLPMAAAIWSCPTHTMLKFPARSFLQFFENHGLLNVEKRPQWQTVINGSHQYIKAMLAHTNQRLRIHTDAAVTQVMTNPSNQTHSLQTEAGLFGDFDHVIFASHADETYAMLDENLKSEFGLLQAFQYQKNTAYLHSDTQLMPKRKATWAAWNYLRNTHQAEDKVAVSYWMNKLQSLDTPHPILVTLNPGVAPDSERTYAVFNYDHPVFDQAALEAQTQLKQVQGKHGYWFAGAYTGYGFHEDGLRSAVELMPHFGVELPWQMEAGQQVRHG